ncbi:MAG: restriction endonuclease [Candidatus Solibacter sp.]|nr:restriction endonuclease [Candidatus Solibacter sp.]
MREPIFDAPYYGQRFAFLNLNVYVDSVYAPEIKRVHAAIQRRTGLLAQCEKRNSEIAALAAKATAEYNLAVSRQEQAHSNALARYAQDKSEYEKAFEAEQSKLVALQTAVSQPGTEGLLARAEAVLRTAMIPKFVSREGRSRLDLGSGILIHEHRFPDLSAVEWVKRVQLRTGGTIKPASQRERKEAALKTYPSLCLRLACELVRLDTQSMVKAVVINGWADYVEKATGQHKRAYCASLFATTEQLRSLCLNAIDPMEAFMALKGLAARSMEVTPIAPTLRFDTNDPRFVDGKEVLGKMTEGQNLASMDWEDFEHLCRELFEKVFAASGAQVKITQVSRDRGVDAIIFDPDALRGGKIVIQAKRYTGTVDVSAVRDLFGTVHNEGAIKGILVTTSHFGVDSYAFAKDKPLTLLDGAQLLGLLEQHGYKFRIDLEEAKLLL